MQYCTAVLLAAGSGSRFDASRTKQTYSLLGKSVLRRSAEVLAACPLVDALVIVVREDETAFSRGELADLKKPYKIVVGGKTRQESAAIGFQNIPAESTEVIIHDAARCLITENGVKEIVCAVRKYGAASAVTAVHDTVKTLSDEGMIVSTRDRSRLCLAATPQGFSVPLYRRALAGAPAVTDDNMLVEHLGEKIYPVYVFENPKITTPEDMLYAEFLLRKRGEGNV
ncbi:MAG: 2-C-methyl-D-erythritol 4-phosphate cytidylyltransferase [Clostridia bacterium]|nr:2-C-methyl-D-erythritol 4-phosphate cytidylyltransferase [Clostridia bacterium]